MPPVPPSPSSIHATLNEAQSRAVSSNAATVAILAGPGSGKTHTLASRVVWLIDNVGYAPEDVLVATFTVKAAREMQERIGKALGNGKERKIILGTFHSIARRYLAAYGQRIGVSRKFGIADDSDSRAIISRICKRMQLSVDPPMARAWISKKKSKGMDTDAPQKQKQHGKFPESQDLETCYQEYQKHLERSNLLDYDDLLVRCVELLRRFPSCVANVQAVLIDEYQDTNGIQYDLMKLFAQKHRRITVVGDPDQSIYGWRSTEIRNLWRFLHDYRGTDEVALEENYRSSQSILDLSLLVIQQDKNRYQKVLRPIRSKGTRPVLRRLRTSSMEADWIISEIRRCLVMTGGIMTHNDVAILLRSASLSRHIETALGKAGIAYKMVGGFKFYERAEIKIILDYLRVIHQPDNNDALARIINVPKRGVGDGTVKALMEEAEKSSLSLWNLLVKHCRGDRFAKTKITKQAEQRISGDLIRLLNGIRQRTDRPPEPNSKYGLVEMIDHLLTQVRFERFLRDTHPEDHEQRWANVQEFITMASDFVKELDQTGDETLPDIEGMEQSKETEVLPRFLANVSLASDAQRDDKTQQNKPQVTISTIHAAKGLEWPIVFVPATYNGSIPHVRSEDNDEERRLLYVAMTRAKAMLYLSCPLYSSQSNGERNELSSFISPVAGHFAGKGPCFEKPILKEIARILGRKETPPQEMIFASLPSMFCTEDSTFPVDPEENRQNFEKDRSTASHPEGAPRAKRPRLHGPVGSQDESADQPWRKEYSTTMEQATKFTVASLPGFVSAGAHQVALAAATSAREAGSSAQKSIKPSTTKRPPDQRSLLSFVRTTSSSASGTARAPPVRTNIEQPLRKPSHNATKSNALQPPPRSGKEPPSIEPELAGHKLGGKMMKRPVPVKQREEAPRKLYACFSSSPTRPSEGGKKAPVPRKEDENVEPPPEPTRPAACLHITTCNMPKGLAGGFRRPAGLGRDGIAPMDKLRKPFKPLTINRS